MIERILIVGTGLLGASTGLALRAHGFAGEVTGWDPDAAMLQTALRRGALTSAAQDPLHAAKLPGAFCRATRGSFIPRDGGRTASGRAQTATT
jgi:2-polyprenyl-6-methoxyphenol hydroxylase-like FAD-dependent oxidoreductase